MPVKRLDTAAVFEKAFDIYRRQARVLLPSALLINLAPAALSLSGNVTARALALAAAMIATVWYVGMVVQAVVDLQDGKADLSLGKLFRSVSPVFGPLLWTAILIILGFLAGLFAFVIPGLILLTLWSVAPPAVVIERCTPLEALARSRALVRGRAWQVFGVLMVVGAIVLVVRLILVSIAHAISAGLAAFAAAYLIGGVLTAPVLALVSSVLYLTLTATARDAPPPAQTMR